MAELADAPDLGSGVPDVQVQVLSSAPKQLVNAVCIYELFVFMVDIFTDVRSSSPVICTIPSVLTGLKRFCMTLGFFVCSNC